MWVLPKMIVLILVFWLIWVQNMITIFFKIVLNSDSSALLTRSSAIAEGPRDASCQLKSCILPCNSAETTCTTSPKQIEVIKLEG